jgi:hypothetical protein
MEEATPAKKSGAGKMLAILFVLLVVLGGAGFAIWKLVLKH